MLNRMELLNQELQLQPGEADFSRGLLALNVAQDHFESLLALHPEVMGDSFSTLTQTALAESTPFPSGVLRIDRLQFMDPQQAVPAWDLINLKRAGSHMINRFWPWNIISQVSPGRPVGYYTNGTTIFWSPTPDTTNTIRWYGFKVADDIIVGGSFAYQDIALLPVCSFAVQLMRTGVDDDNGGISAIAQQTFNPVITALSMYNRDMAPGLDYKYTHNT
jgi:hypothetical protein